MVGRSRRGISHESLFHSQSHLRDPATLTATHVIQPVQGLRNGEENLLCCIMVHQNEERQKQFVPADKKSHFPRAYFQRAFFGLT